MVLGSCISLQLGAACAAQLFPLIGPTPSTLLRMAVAAVVLLALTRPRARSLTRQQWRAVVLLGLALAAMNGFFYASIARIPLGTAVTVEFLGPLALAALTSRRARDFAWVALALGGVVLLGLTGHGPGTSSLDPVGVIFALVAGGFWAAYILANARVGAQAPGLGGLALATAVGALLLLPLGGLGAAQALAQPGLLLLIAGTGVLASVIPYSLELSALRRLGPGAFGVLLSLEPAVAALAGWLLLSQGMHLLGIVAIALVVTASAGSTLTRAPLRTTEPPALVTTPPNHHKE
ncbi:DMT family transporter [uncultured Pseudokineococcus sp.]|uniref:EamA family transporter n=1 Tax=uncultured Pseudokineococcus sp. TaxID=1642928 RepID=UPI002612DB9A|nr:EamA family transporter [uncultured Pseudokineococcus sp.]